MEVPSALQTPRVEAEALEEAEVEDLTATTVDPEVSAAVAVAAATAMRPIHSAE